MRGTLPKISELSLEAKLGQLFVVGFEGSRISRGLRGLLEKRGFGGVALFARNVRSAKQLARLCAGIRGLDTPLPPIISVDQEGGPVMRLRVPPFTAWPAAGDVARYVARTGDLRIVRRLGEAMGRELAAVGIHWNFAPVLDVNTNPRNPVIGVRAFGDRPADVARLALALDRGIRSAGIITTGKHFPGHGDTVDDSHFALPLVKRSARSLARIELAPFRAAARARIPTLMTAHVLYPAWDRKRAATFSPVILQDILRGRLGFRGAIVTDDLSMAGATHNQTIEEASFNALASGADILLICHDPQAQRRAHRHLIDCARRGDLPLKRIDEALNKMIALKRRYVLGGARRRPTPISRIGHPEHQRIVSQILSGM